MFEDLLFKTDFVRQSKTRYKPLLSTLINNNKFLGKAGDSPQHTLPGYPVVMMGKIDFPALDKVHSFRIPLKLADGVPFVEF